MPRPFSVLGVQQIALAGLDRSALEALWTDCLGLEHTSYYRSVAENVDEAVLRAGRGLGRVEFDLMQPIDPAGRPATHAPALHHVGLWIDDLRAAVAWLVQRGVRFTRGGIRPGATGHAICFVHPKPSRYFPIAGQGVLIELVQAPPDVIAAYHAAGR
jgi:lactoylglutathione lyase